MKKLITKKEYAEIIKCFNQIGGFGGELKTIDGIYLSYNSESGGKNRIGVITINFDEDIHGDVANKDIEEITFDKNTTYNEVCEDIEIAISSALL